MYTLEDNGAQRTRETYSAIIVREDLSSSAPRSSDLPNQLDQEMGPIPATSIPHDLATEFENWLHTNYPQLEIDERPGLSSITEIAHYSLALSVMLIWVGDY